jgi:LmbE family N-acetylglucosaminyl deacetylase
VVVIVTDGAGSHPNSRRYPPERLRGLRQKEARQATALLGLPPDRLHFMGLRDTAAPTSGPAFDDAVSVIAAIARQAGSGVIVAPWLDDPHCDHEAVQLMARAVARRTGLAVLSYPVWGWTLPPDAAVQEPRIQGWRLDIAAHLPAKMQAIAAHKSQLSDLIDDDPDGFRLPPALLAVFERAYEVLLTS